MISLNLLPDVKKEYIKSLKTKRMIIAISFMVSGAFIILTIIAFGYARGGLTFLLNREQGKIDSNIAKLNEKPDLAKILTVQKQLEALPGLHQEKPVTSRLFNFMSQLVPNSIALNSVKVSLEDETIEFSGESKQTDTKDINVFADMLKNAKYKYEANGEKLEGSAFSSVVVEGYNISEEKTTFTISLFFDPIIFEYDRSGIVLEVPSITSTRSETERPKDLFEENEAEADSGSESEGQ